MKINQVEELVGITKKNIRFYEDQELLKPERNPNNGYREYSLNDVALLKKIKLLRKLAVPIEDIRKLESGEKSIQDCMNNRLKELRQLEKNMLHTRYICQEMLEKQTIFDSVNVEYYLEEMEMLEKGGTQFMNVEQTDKIRKKKKVAPIILTIATVVCMLLFIVAFLQLNEQDPAPFGIIAFMVVMCILVMVGVVYACYERMKEIEGGEWDEARKY